MSGTCRDAWLDSGWLQFIQSSHFNCNKLITLFHLALTKEKETGSWMWLRAPGIDHCLSPGWDAGPRGVGTGGPAQFKGPVENSRGREASSQAAQGISDLCQSGRETSILARCLSSGKPYVEVMTPLSQYPFLSTGLLFEDPPTFHCWWSNVCA